MEGDGEDAVGEVEGFLDAVPVVDVDVDVEDAGVVSIRLVLIFRWDGRALVLILDLCLNRETEPARRGRVRRDYCIARALRPAHHPPDSPNISVIKVNTPEQLQNSQHDIIHITKPARLPFFCMMQPARPIHRYIRTAIRQPPCGRQGSTGVLLAERKDVVENRAVVSEVEGGAVALRRGGLRHFGRYSCFVSCQRVGGLSSGSSANEGIAAPMPHAT